MRLDELLEDGRLSPPLAIKLDTQGAKARIFAGERRAIAGADLIFFEYTPYLSARTGFDLELLTNLVREHFTEGAISPHGETHNGFPVAGATDIVGGGLRRGVS